MSFSTTCFFWHIMRLKMELKPTISELCHSVLDQIICMNKTYQTGVVPSDNYNSDLLSMRSGEKNIQCHDFLYMCSFVHVSCFMH